MKKILVCLVLVLGLFSLTACNNDTEPKEEDKPTTVAGILASEFKTLAKEEKDMSVVASKLSENENIKIKVMAEELTEESYIFGFDDEIKGFKSGYIIAPMISTQPFVAYIFEVEKPEEFLANLKDKANLRWNICTEADEYQSAIVDNYVFFVMSPNNFDN
ncbi:MAG: hypothetical protein PUA90_05885 [bacterium]|nr:hypothetical protein [bacterium]